MHGDEETTAATRGDGGRASLVVGVVGTTSSPSVELARCRSARLELERVQARLPAAVDDGGL